MMQRFYDNPKLVNYWAARTAEPDLMLQLAWQDVLRRNLAFNRTVPGRQRFKVLDVGCGTGFLALHVAQLGHNVIGLDASDAMLEVAQQRADELDKGPKSRCDFVLGDATQLEFEENEFDAVIGRFLLSELHDPAKAVAEWFRVLKPGGRLFLIEDDWGDLDGVQAKERLTKLKYRGVFSAEFEAQRRRAPFATATPAAIAALLQDNGFADIDAGRLSGQLQQQDKFLLFSYELDYGTVRAVKPNPNQPIDLPLSP
jgi:ubiquinone/menaquinone biosynthesis C-methylase UbiE